MKKSSTETLERQELIQKMIDNGFGDLVEVFLMHEGQTYTKRGRVNKSGACRVLGCTPKELDAAFAECRKLLKDDFSL